MRTASLVAACAALAGGAMLVGCGAGTPSGVPKALLLEARPIGHGARFHPGTRGPVLGRCRRGLGPRAGVHVEVFAADRVVLIAAGIGVRAPVRLFEGRIAAATCYGSVVTLEPTGVVLVRLGSLVRTGDLFRSWGQPLAMRRLLSFSGRVRVFVSGRPWSGSPGSVPLTRHAEIVLEVGPYVPPHASYTFPPGA